MEIASPFDYAVAASLDVRDIQTRSDQGVVIRNLTFAPSPGVRRAAYVVRPEGQGPFAAILYVHWYEPWALTSNRRQFLAEAKRSAQRGAISLLVETMWSDDDWFYKRTQADDRENSIRQVVELRRGMDLLLMQPGVDARRLAYVGHDFGALYGVLMASIDPRPACYVLMAGTSRLSDWYLYYPSLEGEARESYVRQMEEFDPITHVSKLAPAPLLFQFGQDDPHVPQERAQAFYAAADNPKEMRWYAAQHELNELATNEREAWLSQRLELAPSYR